ncbi:type IX secretion system anionic LPS delivery protein PorZ [Flavobacterium sp.]|uniref:type IX secretion system anionic LPS delivery protein PorZ n=3 Tax=Flavobacterium sp. TaxID=239 RepID=UPI004047BA50
MKFKYIVILFFLNHLLFSQGNQLWKSYFSYNEIVDVEASSNTVFAATENAIFSKNNSDGNVDILNSVNGFKPESITAIHYSEEFDKKIAGNLNGLILISDGEGNTQIKVDIIEEVPVAPNKKRINDIYEHNGKVYIATDYGISVLNLVTSEFISTYFIGPSGQETEVFQTTVLNDEIYAVTRQYGIRKASLSNQFLYDFNQWQTFDGGFWSGIVTFNDEIVAVNTNSISYRYSGGSFQQILNHVQQGKNIKTNDGKLIITTQNHVYVLNDQFIQLAHITNIPSYNVVFSAANVVGDELFIGTGKDGLFVTSLLSSTSFENISPDGPVRNYIFRVKKTVDKLWAVYGGYTLPFVPILNDYGISYFQKNNGWTILPFDTLLGAKCFTSIESNPNNVNEVFFSSYYSGLLKIKNDEVTLFDNTNTGMNGLEPIVGSSVNNIYDGSIRVNSPVFDKEGNLWMTSAFVTNGLKVMRTNGQWQSYEFSSILGQAQVSRFAPISIDKNGTKWLPTRNDGLLGFNDKLNNKSIVVDDMSGLPSTIVQCVEIDNRNQLWIGTFKGLRVISSVDRFVSENMLSATAIIIQEGDLAQELFYQQSILDIKVDGANRKWVSIADGGVFLVSSNGQQTIHRFTNSNSPLPSDNVNDIEIDEVTGEVFFATDKGMVSFLGTSTKPSDDLANVYVYPNPVRPEFNGTIKIAGLTDKANVKITDIEGNLVYEVTSAGGTIEWDTSAFGGYKVASGVYMVFVASQDGLDSTVKKVMIIR